MKTVVGLYEEITDAQLAINELVRAGFDRANISLVATNRWADETMASTSTDDIDENGVMNPSQDVYKRQVLGHAVGQLVADDVHGNGETVE